VQPKRRRCQVPLCGVYAIHSGICASHCTRLPAHLVAEIELAYHACPARHFTELYRGAIRAAVRLLSTQRDEMLDELTLAACEGDALARLAVHDRMLELGLVQH
jgi:hypothetical protein